MQDVVAASLYIHSRPWSARSAETIHSLITDVSCDARLQTDRPSEIQGFEQLEQRLRALQDQLGQLSPHKARQGMPVPLP